MPVSKETVLHTGKLARLNLRAGADGTESDERLNVFARQMEEIVAYMDILETADTGGVEPMYSPMLRTAPPREDQAVSDYSRDEALQNAPERDEGFFLVPRVI